MKNSLLLAAILMSGTAFGQWSFSLKGATNYSHLNSVENSATMVIPIPVATGYSSYTLNSTVKQSYKGLLGGELGFRTTYGFSTRFFATTGIGAYLWRYESAATIQMPELIILFPRATTTPTTGSPFGSIVFLDAQGNVRPTTSLQDNTTRKITLWNIQLPVLAGATLLHERIQVKAGPAFHYMINASYKMQEYSLQNGGTETVTVSSTDEYNVFQVAGLLEVTFKPSRHIGIDLSAQHFFADVYTDNSYKSPGLNSFSAGMSYHF